MFAKKNLVAAAALLALVGAAQAQSSVKLYGYLEAGVGSYKAVDGKSTTKVTSGDMMTSFIGFSGSEDLGGGLKAEFVLESFIGVDSGENVKNQAKQFWGRGSWVGLSGGFGKLAIGQYDTPLFVAGLSYNPFGSSMTYSPTMRHFYNLGSTQNAKITNLSKADTGWINSLTYETPNFAGFTGTLQFAPKESSSGADSSSYTLGAAYNAGPLSAMVVYGDSGKTTPSINQVAADAYPTEFKYASFNASYDFGVAKAFVQYGELSNSGFSGGARIDTKLYALGASVPVSAKGKVLASYGVSMEKPVEGGATPKTKHTVLTLAYDHYLSKRTDIYTAVMVDEEKLPGFKTGRTYLVGLRHAF